MRRALNLLPLLTLLGCGTAAGPSYDPPFVTLHGTITSSAVATPATVRVALVWNLDPKVAPASSFRAVQELDVRAEFPVGFRLDVRTLPPADAMRHIDPSKTVPGYANAFAIGTLVVYEDTNGNGKLDLVAVGGTPSDRVLGAPERLEIIYLEGGGFPKDPQALPTDEGALDHSAGFNLIVEPTRADLVPGCTGCGGPVGPWTKLSLDADLSIALTAEPQLSRALCEQTGGDVAVGTSGCAPCIGEACARCKVPANAKVTCSADRTAFVAKSCAAATLCAERTCETVSGRRDGGAPVPAGWPCP